MPKRPPLPFTPRNPTQSLYWDTLLENQLVFGVGPAGTGKTHVAAHAAVDSRLPIVIIRPTVAVEDEEIGLLPGEIDQKMGPWMTPVVEELKKVTEKGFSDLKIEYVPIAYIRGRNFDEHFIHVSEAQNLTVKQARAIVTRLGEFSKMVIEGDLAQSDIGPNNGLTYLLRVAAQAGIPHATVRFSSDDIVRSRIVKMWVKAFEKEAAQRAA